MKEYSSRLDAFFSPHRIAVVGASEQGMYPAGILRSLIEFGYEGEIYPINPKRETVLGLRCFADITQTPSPPDLAILVVPRQAVLTTIGQCIQAGVPAAVVITAGFAEADEEGKALQAQIVDLLQDQPLTLVGPNCAGLADFKTRTIATPLSAPPHSGPVSFVSQSGALMMALYGVFAERHIGVNRLLSLGNQVDVDLSEGCHFLAKDQHTEVIGAFIEDIQDGPGFTVALRQALITGKPLVLLKSGQTEGGQAAAASHTAALAGSARVFNAVCQQFGAVQVGDIRELVDTIQVAAAFGQRLFTPGRVALISQSGGLGSLTADFVDIFGLTAPPLSASLTRRLRALSFIPDLGVGGNPTDVRGPSVIGAATSQTLAPFLEDPETDVAILLLAKSTLREQDAETAKAIVAAAQNSPKPLCVVWVGQRYSDIKPQHLPANEILRQAGIPLFEQPGDCIRALAKMTNYWRFREKWLSDVKTSPLTPPNLKLKTSSQTNLVTSLSPAKKVIAYADAEKLLSCYQIPLVAARVVSSIQEAKAAAEEIGYPVVLKAISPEVPHKTDAGLVRINLQTPTDLETAAQHMLTQLDDKILEGLLVQKMLPLGVEVILGVSYDPQFGPVLAFGAGGILVELLEEISLHLPPLTHSQARVLIQRTKVWPLLRGFRGNPTADIDSLVEMIVHLSQLAIEQTDGLQSLDLNPVIVLPEGRGAFVVDCRVVRKEVPNVK